MKKHLSAAWFWIVDYFASRHERGPADDSLAKTIRDSSHIAAGGAPGGAGISRSSTETHHRIASTGHRQHTNTRRK